jgi:hypothetical protein
VDLDTGLKEGNRYIQEIYKRAAFSSENSAENELVQESRYKPEATTWKNVV